ncbi:MAG: hypothetical protein HY890_05865 [Deltaproteobacteria bacterium]|nr:hypothetical protein [Deltaproteobacteria bacterium]
MHTKKAGMFASLVFIIAGFVAGCSPGVRYKISNDFSAPRAPMTVAVMPATGVEVPAGVREAFRNAAWKKLKGMNYGVLPLERVDEAYVKYGSRRFEEMTPAEAARAVGADAVFYIRITDWDEDIFLSYAALRMKASFSLHSGGGKTLWEAAHGGKESDMRFDRKLLEISVLKAYEPRIDRLVDTALSTLPALAPERKKEDRPERFFDWLSFREGVNTGAIIRDSCSC